MVNTEERTHSNAKWVHFRLQSRLGGVIQNKYYQQEQKKKNLSKTPSTKAKRSICMSKTETRSSKKEQWIEAKKKSINQVYERMMEKYNKLVRCIG